MFFFFFFFFFFFLFFFFFENRESVKQVARAHGLSHKQLFVVQVRVPAQWVRALACLLRLICFVAVVNKLNGK